MTAFVAFQFNFLLEKPAKNCFIFVKVPILLLKSLIWFGFGDFSSGSVLQNQKILVWSITRSNCIFNVKLGQFLVGKEHY